MNDAQLFDEWPERYDAWFTTPIGRLVRRFEGELVQELLDPGPGDIILDAGCGTGVFTSDLLAAGAEVVGLDISKPMVNIAGRRTSGQMFSGLQGDMLSLPFKNDFFTRSVSVTAIEFIANGERAVEELFRVTRPGGCIVVASLNSLSSWAVRRKAKTLTGQRHILENAVYRSPEQMLALVSAKGVTRTAIHFGKDDDPAQAVAIEKTGQARGLDTGAFVAVRWQKQ